MDQSKKKMLTQSVGYMQNRLVITPEFLQELRQQRILTQDEAQLVEKDESSTGRVLELVCILKKKDTRTYNGFVACLEKKYPDVAGHLKKSPTDLFPDCRTLKFLEQRLGKDSPCNPSILATNVILKSVHNDIVSNLDDQITRLKLSNQTGGGGKGSSSGSSGSSTPEINIKTPRTPGRPGTSSKWNLPATVEDLRECIRDKDVEIARHQEAYESLRASIIEVEKENQMTQDLNSNLWEVIDSLKAQTDQMTGPRGSPSSREDVTELQAKLRDYEQKNSDLQDHLERVATDLETMETTLTDAENKIKEFKKSLGLRENATDNQVEEKIEKLHQAGCNQEVVAVQKQLQRALQERMVAESNRQSLVREKERLEFDNRQQRATMKRMSNMIRRPQMLRQITQHSQSEPNTHRPATTVSATPKGNLALAAGAPKSQPFCLFCRSEYIPLRQSRCLVHHKTYKNKKWGCCHDNNHMGAGCLQVPHMYIEVTADKRKLLTDGAVYMELK